MSQATKTSWIKPAATVSTRKPVLKLYNTLTHSKVEFVPQRDDQVTWYSCGPTVYNVSHMGHARNYVTIDINRRILQDYFHYNVKFVQNVTDIDDKIIVKARQEYLFAQFTKDLQGQVTESLIRKAKQGLLQYVAENLPDFKGDVLAEFKAWTQTLNLDELKISKPKVPMHVKACNAAVDAINGNADYSLFIANTKDVIMPVLDVELGSTVTNPAIFRNCAAYWERMFDSDMHKLNVLPPTVITRVSEYIPDIVAFVFKIVDNGFGYVTKDGSVYFNTVKFDNDSEHSYARNQPWSKHDMALIEDGEGSLSLDHPESKINPSDFALWKASKQGEPSWKSPWGQGRPGWHIECSVMASDVFGEHLDIHSGGIDLAFPHHDNECAQSEAHFGCKQWVSYFLHTGHLHIQGQKMSKSLKNFITIEQALNKYSSRELRLCFALVQWNNPLDFKDSLLAEARGVESSLTKFFQKVRALNADNESKLQSGELISKRYGSLEKQVMKEIDECRNKVEEALCDNLATPLAIRALTDLVTQCNNYIKEVGTEMRVDLLVHVVKYLTKMLGIFGFEVREDEMGWKEGSEDFSNERGVESIAMPYVKVLAQFRDLVRQTAIDKGDYKILIAACDKVRDRDLLKLNVAIDDRSGKESSLVKFVSDKEKTEMFEQQEEKAKQAEEAQKRKLQQKKANEVKERARLEKAGIDPKEMYKDEIGCGKYSDWDGDGIPTKDKEGEELSKSARKKLIKKWKQQAKLYGSL
ncbi:hypothetical protein FOA43_004626 [Brettanomyces nanus]|uniref:cysteine--tRNA ligase n=1 Tax=Eeniella nana TaxID=13502 RepID=A0A875SCP0_EENNA|nr:uncharacterized protein FOA43_004626 [Brettanomyces nanus]QPG77219.1 hypothetical protein FOA43_004626 [Brettanomyces nanus]